MTKESAKQLKKQGEQKTKKKEFKASRAELENQLEELKKARKYDQERYEELKKENVALHNRLDETDINLKSLKKSAAELAQKSDKKSAEILNLEDKCMLLEAKTSRSGMLSVVLAVVTVILTIIVALTL